MITRQEVIMAEEQLYELRYSGSELALEAQRKLFDMFKANSALMGIATTDGVVFKPMRVVLVEDFKAIEKILKKG